ncbi:hypothetical protein [Halorubellus salinus]|uniref:hypothetical protein n=1 Tax=Halorubellus salinus TaxID=755309 RepID=UPI001D05EC47|nr:hypothetical protein [Halorubellus salinus]
MDHAATRRRLLATVGALALAGCLTGTEDTDDGDADAGTDGTDADPAETGSAGTDGGDDATGSEPSTADGTDGESTTTAGETTTDGLDLREANVTGVELEAQGDGRVRFSVTLYHDDEGEDGYANWWTVETLDGEELGRRELLHAHGTREFTRSETVSVPIDVECVVVRGHDQTHGYGGQAALVSVSSGATRVVRQGPARSSFADASCP